MEPYGTHNTAGALQRGFTAGLQVQHCFGTQAFTSDMESQLRARRRQRLLRAGEFMMSVACHAQVDREFFRDAHKDTPGELVLTSCGFLCNVMGARQAPRACFLTFPL